MTLMFLQFLIQYPHELVIPDFDAALAAPDVVNSKPKLLSQLANTKTVVSSVYSSSESPSVSHLYLCHLMAPIFLYARLLTETVLLSKSRHFFLNPQLIMNLNLLPLLTLQPVCVYPHSPPALSCHVFIFPIKLFTCLS